MARKKSAISRALDLKPRLFRSFSIMTRPVPASRSLISFYPEIEDVSLSGGHALLNDLYGLKLSDPAYLPQLAVLSQNCWDVHRNNVISRDPFAIRRGIWMVPDAIVPGHTLAPVNPRSRKQIGVGRSGEVNWFYARPWLLPHQRIDLELPAMSVPAIWNMWHLLIEFLLPLAKAAQIRAWGDSELQILTRANRPRVIDAMVEGLNANLGTRIRIVAVEPSQRLHVKQLLVADSVCWNVERSFGFAETMNLVRSSFKQSYLPSWPTSQPSERLYLTRGRSKLRQITNEPDVIALVQRLGFSVLEARWDQHVDQIAAFAGARHIVGVHGAGLTNILFSDPGARVFEIFPDDHRKTSMLHLSAEMGHTHEPFFGSTEGHNQAFSVDLAALEARLEAFVAH